MMGARHSRPGSFTLIAVTLAALLATGCQRWREERALRQQVREYQRAWEEGRFDRMWDFLSQRTKDGNPKGPEAFGRIFSGTLLSNIHATTEAVYMFDDVALVHARWRGTTVDNKTVIELDEQRWSKEHGRWVFDDYRALKWEER